MGTAEKDAKELYKYENGGRLRHISGRKAGHTSVKMLYQGG